jgi:uncharacterized damage-inducible protein DinB
VYASVESFLEDWKGESATTLRVLKLLTDASLAQKVSPEGRTLGFIAWHVVLTIVEMGSKAGLAIAGPAEDSPPPAEAARIAVAYQEASGSLAAQLRARWTDRMLSEELPLYGSKWRRVSILSSIVRHQIHHRGQMTVLLRQAGLPVPGIYGPAREEWQQMGMKPQD